MVRELSIKPARLNRGECALITSIRQAAVSSCDKTLVGGRRFCGPFTFHAVHLAAQARLAATHRDARRRTVAPARSAVLLKAVITVLSLAAGAGFRGCFGLLRIYVPAGVSPRKACARVVGT
jgi:hypothetical protein